MQRTSSADKRILDERTADEELAICYRCKNASMFPEPKVHVGELQAIWLKRQVGVRA
jgi:hypothetical protein